MTQGAGETKAVAIREEVCVCVCVRACVHACMCVCVYVCVLGLGIVAHAVHWISRY